RSTPFVGTLKGKRHRAKKWERGRFYMLQRKIRPLSTMAIQIQWQPPRIARSALARNCADRIFVNNRNMNDFFATLEVCCPCEAMVLQICSSSPTSCSKPRKQHEAAR